MFKPTDNYIFCRFGAKCSRIEAKHYYLSSVPCFKPRTHTTRNIYRITYCLNGFCQVKYFPFVNENTHIHVVLLSFMNDELLPTLTYFWDEMVLIWIAQELKKRALGACSFLNNMHIRFF